MLQTLFTPVESAFFRDSGNDKMSTLIPYILVDNFPKLGMLTALRFLEWVSENPEGVISLPTGKTPEYFIKWTELFLKKWTDQRMTKIRHDHGLTIEKRPDLGKLRFVQIDEFYPISSHQHNSFYYYVNKFYIKKFGLDKNRALLINCDKIPLVGGRSYKEVFPDNVVDSSLRYRECKSLKEQIQRDSVFMIDDWCTAYEKKIRNMDGIGFFLGGIGPDGHIAFNTRGSDHYSTTRITATNFETQAIAAGDLGGIEISRNRLVITIGLETITYNPDAVAIIIAAGEAKAGIVKASLESRMTNVYPATVLQKLQNSRFYLTKGAATKLDDRVEKYYTGSPWTREKTERAVIDLCKEIDTYGHNLTIEDLRKDSKCNLIPGVNKDIVREVEQSIQNKISQGLEMETNQTFLHTGPHHDDIMLGILPHISHQLRSATNTFHFAIMTSGFTAVTNSFIKRSLEATLQFIDNGLIQMINYPDFFDKGYLFKWDKDVYHYLDAVAALNEQEEKRGLSHRIIRAIVDIYKVMNKRELVNTLHQIINFIDQSYDGEKNTPSIQTLKGMIREFEEELVWAHFGVQVKNIHHLRLGFYTGDIFTEQPERKRDVEPVLELIRSIDPTVISLTLDPEGSGPDTHYKVLQAIAEALRERKKEKDLSDVRIWGYRNVWYRFHPAEVNVIVPCSINSMSVMNESFKDCYLSQVDASFPSYEHDGLFSTLTQKIWIEQMKSIQLLLGKNYFYENPHPRIRAAHGLILFREMGVDEFLKEARKLEKSIEG